MQRPLLFILSLSAVVAPALLQAQVFPSTVDICMQQDVGASVLRISLRANDQGFEQVVSGLVFTIRWPASSSATLSVAPSPWCPPGSAFNPGPSAQVAPGNGYKYKTWTATGTAWLSELVDNGGCGQGLLADTWTEVLAIPVINGGNTFFEMLNDDFTLADNRNYFISLNGEWIVNGDTLTGTICSASTGVPSSVVMDEPLWLAPNPSTGRVQLSTTDPAGLVMYEVLDPIGRVVLRERFNGQTGPWMIDLTDRATGVYQVRVHSVDRIHTQAVVLERP